MNDLLSTRKSERIPSLDFLRGIAILGILFINIENFAYPDSWNPWKFGFESAIDRSTRFWVYFLTQGKFATMFTLLFGVGFYLFLERLENKNIGLKTMDIYSRRLLWLFVIGIAHSYLIWEGDVLYHYAICGFFLFPFRSIKSKNLVFVIIVLGSLLLVNSYDQTSRRIESYNKYKTAYELSFNLRTEEDLKQIADWEIKISKKESDTTIYPAKKTTYLSGLKETYKHATAHKGLWYYRGFLFRTLIVMILGIILYRSGIFGNYQVWKYYWIVSISLLFVSLVISYFRFYHWTYEYNEPILSIWKGLLFTFPKELLGVSYVLILNGIYQKFLSFTKFRVISTVGQMALTNYIFQNVTLGLLFYGYGFSKFNQYSRSELIIIVLIVWVIQLTLSWIWMSKYKQGPLEWLWRKLTYASFKP